MVPGNPDSAGNGLLGEDSPVGTVLRPGSLAIIAGKEANPSPPPVFAPSPPSPKGWAMSLPHAVHGRHPKGTQKDRRLG
jgi:hypothetical protein